MALSIWLLQGYKSKKNFLISLFFTLGFIIFDIWWQYIFEYDLFGNARYSNNLDRLTGPFRDNPVPGIFMARYLFLLLYLIFELNLIFLH